MEEKYLEENLKALGLLLRKVRKNAGMSQAQMGEKCGVHESTISRAENGESLTMSLLIEIAAAAGCEVKISIRPEGATYGPK